MKIYTKTGDAGETALGDGTRVKKDHHRIQVYGTLDELNATLGLAETAVTTREIKELIRTIQAKLFVIGSIVANPKQSLAWAEGKISGNKEKLKLDESDIVYLEQMIDQHEATLTPLRSFILPGGALGAAFLHLARTVCRRAERELVGLDKSEPLPASFVIYLNRVGDLLFVLARAENAKHKHADILW